ncbi:hypothetical protein MTO96_010862 [Rhipicephalus appendiculatus]
MRPASRQAALLRGGDASDIMDVTRISVFWIEAIASRVSRSQMNEGVECSTVRVLLVLCALRHFFVFSPSINSRTLSRETLRCERCRVASVVVADAPGLMTETAGAFLFTTGRLAALTVHEFCDNSFYNSANSTWWRRG